jgi:hypothetical protein
MQARFQTEDYISSHLNKTINEVVVVYTPTDEIFNVRGLTTHTIACLA